MRYPALALAIVMVVWAVLKHLAGTSGATRPLARLSSVGDFVQASGFSVLDDQILSLAGSAVWGFERCCPAGRVSVPGLFFC